MPSLVAPLRRALLVVLSLAAPVRAQAPASPISHLDDAAPIPAGMLRLRVANVWTRYDERFAVSGSLPLGAELSADSLGSAQFPRLLPIEAALRTIANDPSVRLSLGQLRVGSSARIVVTPIAFEYGVSRRLSVGILVPIVQTRRVARATVSGDSTFANVGYLSTATSRSDAARDNALVAGAFRKAADSLGVLLTSCPSNPGATGCAAVNANTADATATRARAQAFADAISSFGTTAAQALIAPRASSDLADTLDARRTQLNARLQQYLGTSAGASTRIFTASTDFSYIDLNGRNGVPAFLGGPLAGGLDSLRTTERVNFGDIAIGARLMLFDRFQSVPGPTPRVQTRLAVGGAVRLPTSRADSAQNLVDIPTGEGAGVEVNSAWDVILGHFGATIGARYVKSFGRTVQAAVVGDPEAPYPYPLFAPRKRTAGDVLGLDLTPRLLVTDWLSIDGHYGFERVGANTYGPAESGLPDPCAACESLLPSATGTSIGSARTAQRLGFGLRYSTVDAFARSEARFPVQVSYTHLETVTGDAGLPKQTREQIEVRLFYRVRR